MSAEGREAAAPMPKRWQVMALAQRLWEQHGHPGETCEPGSKGVGSCALDEARRVSPPARESSATARDRT